MSLIRGFGGKLPCPICLIPSEKLSDITSIYPLRTSVQSQHIYESAQNLSSASERESLFKDFGLRNVPVCFILITGSLTKHYFRMFSGMYTIWMFTMHFPLITFIHIIVAFLEHTFGSSLKSMSMTMAVRLPQK